MLLNGHHLNGIITILGHARQDILLELRIGAYLLCILRHTYMAFVDQQRTLLRLEVLFLKFVFLLRIPDLCREDFGVVILYHTTTPGRDTLAFATVPLHLHLVKLSVLQGFL